MATGYRKKSPGIEPFFRGFHPFIFPEKRSERGICPGYKKSYVMGEME
jgi:hypothetical protein